MRLRLLSLIILIIFFSITLNAVVGCGNENGDKSNDSDASAGSADEDGSPGSTGGADKDGSSDSDDPLNQCAQPVFSPEPGSYSSEQDVTISTTTPDAIIEYNISRNDGTEHSGIYSEPIHVRNGTSWILATATKPGMRDSKKATGEFVIDKPVGYVSVAPARITPPSDKFYGEQTITITCSVRDSTIRYTTDNTDPSETTGTIIPSGYSFTLSETTTVKAIAYGTDIPTSDVTSETYTFGQWKWTWVAGDNTTQNLGVYGTKGVSSSSNQPGSRSGSVSWIDASGNLWLFGGEGYAAEITDSDDEADYLNDLWKYTPSTGEWTWVAGDDTGNQSGVYGTKGVGSKTNKPGARARGNAWIDAAGDLWLFGGKGYDGTAETGYLNDLWKYTPATEEWTWVAGDDTNPRLGVYETNENSTRALKPGSRCDSTSWLGAEGEFWLFGGAGYSSEAEESLGDLWKYTPSSGKWDWVSGLSAGSDDRVYGIPGEEYMNNRPGDREGSASWTDSEGNLWLFGGHQHWSLSFAEPQYLNDLWRYRRAHHLWSWISPDGVLSEGGVFGTRGTARSSNKPPGRKWASSWTSPTGAMWLFGGEIFSKTDYLNDLWRFIPSTQEWTWISGESALNEYGVYGTKGVGSTSNTPGARKQCVSWVDASGNFWLFGGEGFADSQRGFLNDLWKFEP